MGKIETNQIKNCKIILISQKNSLDLTINLKL